MTDNNKVPTNKEQADALRAALAQYDLGQLKNAQKTLNDPAIAEVVEKINKVVAAGLPANTSIAANLPRLGAWFEDVKRALDADIYNMEALANPAAPIEEAPEVPVV